MSDVMWMDGTAATGWFGFNEFVDINPWRWEKAQSFQDTIKTIKAKRDLGELTVVWIKVPARMTSKTLKYPSVDEAVAAMQDMDPAFIGAKEAWQQAKNQLQHLEEKSAGMDDELARAAKRVTEAETDCEKAHVALDKASMALAAARAAVKEAQEAVNKTENDKEEATQQKKGVQKQADTIQSDLAETRERASKLKAEYDKVA